MTSETIYTQIFRERASVRSFDAERHIAPELLDSLLLAASHAPTTGNMQLYSVIVTRSREGKEALAPLHFNQPAATGCDVMLTFCADLRRFEAWCEARDAQPGFNNFHSFLTAVIDATIFAQQFVTLAELHGIGSVYLGTATYSSEAIGRVLEVPSRVVPVLTLAVGYPAGGVFPAASDRLPLEGIVHEEKYEDYSREVIEKIYAPKEALEESARFIAENGKSTLAQVFTDVRYPRALNEDVSRSLGDYVQRQGF